MYILKFKIIGGYDNILQCNSKEEVITMKTLLKASYSLEYINIYQLQK